MEHEEKVSFLVVLIDELHESSLTIKPNCQPFTGGALLIGDHPAHHGSDVVRRNLRVPPRDPRVNPYRAQNDLPAYNVILYHSLPNILPCMMPKAYRKLLPLGALVALWRNGTKILPVKVCR